MEKVSPPPLPPKTRRPPPQPTVLEEYSRYPQSHVVKIRIDPSAENGITINVNNMIQKEEGPFFYFGNFIGSGQVSPSDTLDSGTCSDLDGTPPPLPKKKNSAVSVTVIGAQHKRASSLTSSADSDDNESSISYDSLNGGELNNEVTNMTISKETSPVGSFLPQGLLQDIRQRNVKLTEVKDVEREDKEVVTSSLSYETDCYYNFHLNENVEEQQEVTEEEDKDETFAGYKDLLSDGSSTIRSAKGTVRGVKNRVRAGIATFLQINSTTKVRIDLYSLDTLFLGLRDL